MKSSRRSRTHKNSHRSRALAVPQMFETLEERRLLTTLRGGDVFEYRDSQDQLIRIQLEGNIVAEFIGATMSASNDPLLVDLTPATAPDTVPGTDLFKIYVTRSDINAYISIAAVPALDESPRPMLPFEGAVELNVFSPPAGEVISIDGPDGSGLAFLGARTADLNPDAPDENQARLAATWTTSFGVMPAPTNGLVLAGLEVVGGQDIGKFLFGGTVTGFVNLTGSIDTFYAGWLLTGDARGYSPGQGIRFADNFRVDGDLRNLIAKGVGRDPNGAPNVADYYTGTDFQVRGSVGQVNVLNNYQATLDVRNAVQGPFLQYAFQEVEYSEPLPLAGDMFAEGFLGWDAHVINDTFENPQYLGTFRDPAYGGQSTIRIVGNLNSNENISDAVHDNVDYYGVSLLAGQTVTVHMPVGNFGLGVFDPDGRLIRTNANQNEPLATINAPFTFTTDRPGVYRFAIAEYEDYEFAGTGTPSGQYSLRITNVGEIALGALRAGGHITNLSQTGQSFVDIYRGDLGAVLAGQSLTSHGVDESLTSRFGNIRTVQAANIGFLQGTSYSLAPNLHAPYGAVGLVSATEGYLMVNSWNFLTDTRELWTPIGGNYQVIEAPGTVLGGIVTNRAIGVIRAGQLGVTNNAAVIAADADLRGNDGIIDLIDVSGNLGTLEAGGPHITTGRGGNVRYMQVGGTVYRDRFFGGTNDDGVLLQRGQSTTIVDDSGTRVTIAPQFIKNPAYRGQLTPGVPEFLNTPAQIRVLTYGIRGSGGSAIVRVVADGSVNIAGVGNGRDTRAEIGELQINASGTPIVPVNTPPVGTAPGTPTGNIQLTPLAEGQTVRPGAVNVNIAGSAVIDVLNTTVSGPADLISNTTGGELPIIQAASIGALQGSTLGLARNTTGAAVNPIATIDNPDTEVVEGDSFPFLGQKIGVVAANIVNVAATEALGNFSLYSSEESFDDLGDVTAPATIQNMIVNSDNVNVPSVYEGIVGPVAARRINNINIGEGLAWSGNGEFSQAGLYVRQTVERIVGNVGADIRGNIVSNDTIGSITLRDGALIGSRIMTLDSGEGTAESLALDWAGSRDIPVLRTITFGDDPVDTVVYEVGPITLLGNGGIMDLVILSADIDSILVPDGFGIFNTQIRTLGSGTVNSIRVGGYGIHNVFVRGGANLVGLQANGSGQYVSSAAFTPDVRLSEWYRIDPFTGRAPTYLTDINQYFGISAAHRLIPNVTVGGVIQDVEAVGQREMNYLYAWRLRDSSFNFADRIRTIQTSSAMRNVGITTGQLDFFQAGDSVSNLDVVVAGPVNTFNILGHVDRLSSFDAVGPSGRFNHLRITGNMAGDVYTTGAISRFIVGGDITNDSLIQAREITSRTIYGRNFGSIVVG